MVKRLINIYEESEAPFSRLQTQSPTTYVLLLSGNVFRSGRGGISRDVTHQSGNTSVLGLSSAGQAALVPGSLVVMSTNEPRGEPGEGHVLPRLVARGGGPGRGGTW